MSATTANHQFITPEVLRIICEYSDLNECAHIARTSRLGFHVATPQIWNTLKSVQPLLMLLSPKVQEARTVTLKLPPFTPQTFERFDHYGPFVRRLTITTLWSKNDGGAQQSFCFSTWLPLIRRAQLGPLLPNLLELRFSDRRLKPGTLARWISSFISPSLQTLAARIPGSSSSMCLRDASPLLALLAQTCPTLKRLSHNFSITGPNDIDFDNESNNDSDDDSDDNPNDGNHITSLILLPLVYGNFRIFQQLRALFVMGYFITSQSLAVISQLPLLGELYIGQLSNRNKSMPQAFKSTVLAPDAFPSLFWLHVHSEVLDDFQAVLEATAVMKGVKELFIGSRNTGVLNDSLFEEDSIMLLSSLMFRNCPKLWCLVLDGGRNRDGLTPEFKGAAWTCMSQLPISHLELRNFRANVISLEQDFPTFPKLKTLKLPQQHVTLKVLDRFGQSPRLENLTVGCIDLSDQIPKVNSGTMSSLQGIQMNEAPKEKMVVRSPDKVARFLISLWPKLQRVDYEANGVSQEGLDLLNLHIRLMQGVIETQNNISARFGADAASSLVSRRLSSV